MAKQIGYACLVIGFLIGAFFATRDVDRVAWGSFIPCAGVMFIGLVLVRASTAAAKNDEKAHSGGIDALERSVGNLVASISEMRANQDSIDVYEVHGRIDSDLMKDIDTFVEARESMIARYGLQQFADIMSAFANGERNLNRAWSASADGYIDEVWASIQRAEARMREASELLAAARAA